MVKLPFAQWLQERKFQDYATPSFDKGQHVADPRLLPLALPPRSVYGRMSMSKAAFRGASVTWPHASPR